MSPELEGFLIDLSRQYCKLIRHAHPQGFVPDDREVMADAMELVGIEPGHTEDQPLIDAARDVALRAGCDPAKCARLALELYLT